MGRYTGRTCRLSTMLLMTSVFFLVEIIFGYLTNSIALVADSFHMLSDVVALIVGFASVRISKWPSKRNTYGWVRAEILGALVNAVFLLALCFSIMVEALKRLVEVEKVDNPKLLLIVGGIGLLVNVVGLFLFGGHGHSHGGGGHGHSHGGGGHGHGHHSHGHKHTEDAHHHHHDHDHDHKEQLANGHGATIAMESERLVDRQGSQTGIDGSPGQEHKEGGFMGNHHDHHDHEVGRETPPSLIEMKKAQKAASAQLNMRGVFLHVLGDALGSVVVIISALVIWLCSGDWKYYIDPAMSVVMVFIILSTTIPLLKDSAFILLQTVPAHVDVENIIRDLEQMEGVYGVHECHIWQLAGNRIVASAHIRCTGIDEYRELAFKIKQLFHRAGIHSTTIQPEFIDWQDMGRPGQHCAIMCESDGRLCVTNTCCGDKDMRMKLQASAGDANKNNSNIGGANGASGLVNSSNELRAGVEGGSLNNYLRRSQYSESTMFSAAPSLEAKFSPDGDEVKLEMTDLGTLEDIERMSAERV